MRLPHNNSELIITRLQYERVRRCLTQRTLGVLTRIRTQVIGQIELGHLVPTQPKLQRLSAVLGVAAGDLLKPYRLVPGEEDQLSVARLRKTVANLEQEV